MAVIRTVTADLVAWLLVSHTHETPTGNAANPPGQEASMQTRRVERRMHTWTSFQRAGFKWLKNDFCTQTENG